MNRPLVSMVMPCYQNGRTLERTVRSIQAQTETDWELIAVDDGSQDDTLAVLNRLAQDEPRMRVIHQENGGVSAARNAGMEAAQGAWLSFVDADDHLLPHALEHLLSLTDENIDIACGAYVMRYRDEGGREEVHACADGDLQTVLESLLRGDSALNSMCARLYRTEMLRRAGVRAPEGVKVRVIPVANHFFGETVTVTGLLTGGDILAALTPEAVEGADEILLCAVTLRHERDLFLDDMHINDFIARAPLPVRLCENEGQAFYDALHGRFDE